jgi:hypothetical protein
MLRLRRARARGPPRVPRVRLAASQTLRLRRAARGSLEALRAVREGCAGLGLGLALALGKRKRLKATDNRSTARQSLPGLLAGWGGGKPAGTDTLRRVEA